MLNNDLTTKLQQSVLNAIADKTPLLIIANNSKAFYGREPQGQPLSVKLHQGIVNYHPSELVITARTGTPLIEIERILAEQGQMLAFEPPHFSETATLGGVIACGLSGSRRPFSGSVRDFVLGCKMINGKGEVLRFGGEVMKNVAGYDVSRLMVGAMGTLGLLLEISLKVLPLPVCERSRYFNVNINEALSMMVELSSKSLPVSGLCYTDGLLMVRLSGCEKAVTSAIHHIGGDECADSVGFWADIGEQRAGFFQRPGDLWRLSLPPATSELKLEGDYLYDWGGALRWLKTDTPAETVFRTALQAEGHATLFRSQNRSGDIFQPLPDKLRQLHGNIKNAFDPAAIFNPYRMSRYW